MVGCSLELGHFLDAAELVVPVVHFEALSRESVVLHALVIPGAERVQVGSLGELLQLLRCLVKVEDLLDAVVVLTHVLFVETDADCPLDLVLESMLHFDLLLFINYKTTSLNYKS